MVLAGYHATIKILTWKLKKRVLLTKDSSSCEGVRNTAFTVKVAQRLVDVFNSLGCEGVFLQFCR